MQVRVNPQTVATAVPSGPVSHSPIRARHFADTHHTGGTRGSLIYPRGPDAQVLTRATGVQWLWSPPDPDTCEPLLPIPTNIRQEEVPEDQSLHRPAWGRGTGPQAAVGGR